MTDALEGLFGDGIKKDREIEQAFAQKQAAAQNASAAKKPGRNEPCPCGSGKKYKKCCIDAAAGTAVAVVEKPAAAPIEEKYDLLEMYPNSAAFRELYEEEAINIDMFVYKALRHRAIPMWVKRDMNHERLGKIDYLTEALKLFSNKCEREQITSFADYDEKYMVHYRSSALVAALVEFTEDDNSPKLTDIRKTASDTYQRFENINILNKNKNLSEEFLMKNIEKNAEREKRIDDEIVVDAYDEYERASGWYCHLEDKIAFPFKSKVIKESGISPLREGEDAMVLGMADQDECDEKIFVEIEWEGRKFGVPLEQLYPVDADEDTVEAVEDWHYWVAMGYCF